MKLTIESTKDFAVMNGVPCRIWRGEYKGCAIEVLMAAVGIDDQAPPPVLAEWEEELVAMVGGPVAYIEQDEPPKEPS